jgi:hypothetical protein
MGRERWIPFAAVEVWAWSQFLQRRNEGRELQSRYRELAWLVARRVSAGTRTEAGWDYYEALSKFQSSGAYDMDPQSPGIQPETNPETFNGSIWVLARALFLPGGPEAPVDEASESYENAIRYYQSRAYRPDLAWNWGGSQLHRQEYADLIRASDENLRRSTTMIGVILANHLLSAVDALVTGRLGLLGEEQRHVEVLLLPAPFERHQIGHSGHSPREDQPMAVETLEQRIRKSLLASPSGPLKAKELARRLQIPTPDYRRFREVLRRMESLGSIYRVKGQRYSLPEKINLKVGTLSISRSEDGFLIPDDRQPGRVDSCHPPGFRHAR